MGALVGTVRDTEMARPTSSIALAFLGLWTFVLTLATVALAAWVLRRPSTVPQIAEIPPAESAEVTPPPEPREIAARGDLAASESTTIEIFRQAAPSVVYITKLAVRADPFRRNLFTIPQGAGSGFVWDDDGHVVTNYHVVQGGDAARVTLSDQSVWEGRPVGFYADADIAVLKIQAPPRLLTPIQVGTSEGLHVGQDVFAIGNPFGLDHTLSTGVVSGLGREIPSIGGRPIQGAIQTDAAINPGNSGGPLLDSAGRLIGVNTQIYSPSGASAGVGFAVPVDTVHRVVTQLIEHGRVVRPGLGIRIDEGGVAARLGIEGAMVLGVVEGSGAERAGLRPARQDPRSGRVIVGDVVTAIDGDRVRTVRDLFRILDTKNVGDNVRVEIRRGERALTVQITLIGLNG